MAITSTMKALAQHSRPADAELTDLVLPSLLGPAVREPVRGGAADPQRAIGREELTDKARKLKREDERNFRERKARNELSGSWEVTVADPTTISASEIFLKPGADGSYEGMIRASNGDRIAFQAYPDDAGGYSFDAESGQRAYSGSITASNGTLVVQLSTASGENESAYSIVTAKRSENLS